MLLKRIARFRQSNLNSTSVLTRGAKSFGPGYVGASDWYQRR